MFEDFIEKVQYQFSSMKKTQLYRTSIEKDLLWETYLQSFPEGSNPRYNERTEHDCSTCKHFIKAIGNVVTIEDGRLISIWDVEVESPYQEVADALGSMVKAYPVQSVYLHECANVGTAKNFGQDADGNVETFEHFHVKLPKKYVKTEGRGAVFAESQTAKEQLMRSLQEIETESIEIVLELIEQNSIYRGEEHAFALQTFLGVKKEFEVLETNQDLFCWDQSTKVPQSVSRIRGTAIGSLLLAISEGEELDRAVASFESKVAPSNYKRPSAVITKSMIANAKKKVDELGFSSALQRRYAVASDLTINNVLFADRDAKKEMSGDIFAELEKEVSENIKHLDKVEEVDIQTFVDSILPKARSLEVLFENRHAGNLVSLIAPDSQDSKNMFKWGNNFSWTYIGDVADSIKEKVKNAGGAIDGDFRASLAWFNYDDLDLHLTEPGGNKIHFNNKHNAKTLGRLDVDMNVTSNGSRNAVENITYPDRKKMKEGKYKLVVNNYAKRESIDVGFEVELEFDGILHTFAYDKAVGSKRNVTVAEFEYSHKHGIKFLKSLQSSSVAKELCGLQTENFQKVSMFMYSPNHWDGEFVGNRHFFFMLEGCRQDGSARGFYNEFLTEELREHRKVFEVLGSKMRAPESEEQLTGLGFASTKRNSIFCKVSGNFSRTIKINF